MINVRQFTTWHRPGSRGMTLLELMVAMLVLLIGIWTIAAGFPKLLANLTSEGERTEMARLVQRNMERLKDTEGALPWAIAGDPTISPYSEPEDITEPSRPANAQENLLDVIGEAFQIPGAQPDAAGTGAQASSAYVLQQGPAQWCNYPETDSYPFVYILIPLTEQRVDPRVAGNPMLPNSFYVDEANGRIFVPETVYTYDGSESTAWSVDELLVNYAWAETGGIANRPPTHYVQDERAIDDAYTASGDWYFSVRATARSGGDHDFSCLIEGRTAAQAIVYFDREEWDDADNLPDGRGRYVLNNDYGVELRFHRDDAGLTAYVDYRLRDVEDTNGISAESGRRKLMMIEDHVINNEAVRTDDVTGDSYAEVKLAAGNINDEMPLFSQDLSGTELTSDVYLLAVDLTTGAIYTGGENITLYDDTLSPKLERGFLDGVVAVRLDIGDVQQPYVGRTMRFYYSTLDYHNVQLQKPARTFVDLLTAQCYTGPYLDDEANEPSNLVQVDYRTYRVLSRDTDGDDDIIETSMGNMDSIVLEFVAYVDHDDDTSTAPVLDDSAAVEGHTISVDYVWYEDAYTPHYVYGEMHTVPPGANQIALQHFSYYCRDDYPSAEIIAVRGVSARAMAWWLTRKGRQQHVAIDSYTLKGTLGFTHRIR